MCYSTYMNYLTAEGSQGEVRKKGDCDFFLEKDKDEDKDKEKGNLNKLFAFEAAFLRYASVTRRPQLGYRFRWMDQYFIRKIWSVLINTSPYVNINMT